MTLPQYLTRAMRQTVAEFDDLQPEDAPALAAAVEVFRGFLAREDARLVRKVGGGTKARKPADGPTDAVRDAVARRSRGFCEVGALGCMGQGVHLHHRLMRSQGGGHAADNLLNVCRLCHDLIHAEPTWAYERGWLLHRTAG